MNKGFVLLLYRLSSDKLNEQEEKTSAVKSGNRQKIEHADIYCNKSHYAEKSGIVSRLDRLLCRIGNIVHNADGARNILNGILARNKVKQAQPDHSENTDGFLKCILKNRAGSLVNTDHNYF